MGQVKKVWPDRILKQPTFGTGGSIFVRVNTNNFGLERLDHRVSCWSSISIPTFHMNDSFFLKSFYLFIHDLQGYNSLKDYFPAMEMRPNPQCSNPACVQRQVFVFPQIIAMLNAKTDEGFLTSSFSERIYGLQTC